MIPRNRLFSSTARKLWQNRLRLDQNAPIDVHPEVEEAIQSRKAVVALETTIVTHGMPFPTNLETAQSLERIVRSTGSIPATIGVIAGRVKIGLQPSELERLADTSRNPSVVKISRRDIGPVLAMKRDGGTTCSATLIFAASTGIKVFATGGLGGVHRGGQSSLDISADLQELARCPVGLVSAGVKSILDIGRTLEYLETLGVPVVSYGNTDDFPAFFSPRSGFKAPWHVNTPKAAAQILLSQWQLGMTNGSVFAAPIPAKYEVAGEKIQNAVEQAVVEAEELGISSRGKAVTPWLLNRIADLTAGASLINNVALIENTALIGGQIVAEYARLVADNADVEPVRLPHSYRSSNGQSALYSDPHPLTSSGLLAQSQASNASETGPIQVGVEPSTSTHHLGAKLLVVGCAAVDISAKSDATSSAGQSWQSHSTSPGKVTLSLGGVGRNMAEAAHRVLASQGHPLSTVLLSCIGDDAFGRLLAEETQRLGMRTDGLIQAQDHTAVCNMLLDAGGNLVGGVADMDIVTSLDQKFALAQIEGYTPDLIALDGNLPSDLLSSIVKHCYQHDINVFFEPTSVTKSAKIFPAIAAALNSDSSNRSPIMFSSPNVPELAQMYQTASGSGEDLTSHDHWWRTTNNFSLGSEFRADLEQLARRDVSDHDLPKGTLSFIIDEGVAQRAVNLLPFFQHLVIKCGKRGIIVAMRIHGQDTETSGWRHESSNALRRCVVATNSSTREIVVIQHFPAPQVDKVVNVTGAGDSLVGYLLASLIRNPGVLNHPNTLKDVMDAAQTAAVLTLQSRQAVSPLLSAMQS